ncbi:adenylate/guanylate cyclase domain-containing protein [Rhodococcus maanshanensis]|uniref:Adenylate cyclase, class 3 n=1 Tax=Rhodococcus maanshanensis TaxID=183556 RepID=A0A1H7W1Y4_9NOCA|nr:adenylate/guanylate cyclase domain-containing protein [Rhodococcus maanshanensis]SEM15493.1 Adenylate cyclase, class 3 [Rhodococcus maanshanensis]
MDPPGTRYVERDGHALAYQVVGEGDVDVVWYFELNMHLDLLWTDPQIHYLLDRGTTFARTAYLQRRGVGLSDPVDHIPTLEQQAGDLLAVMDEIGMRSATLVGVASACGPVALLAARAPERVAGLVLIQAFAERLLGTGTPPGWDPADIERFIGGWRSAYAHWGSGASVPMWDPAVDSPFNRRLMALLERCTSTPATAQAHFEHILRVGYSEALPSIQCPTRVLLVPASPVSRGASRHVADLIPNGSFHLLPQAPAGASLGEAWVPILDHVEVVATGEHHPGHADRFLAALLFTDPVGSTEVLARIGDDAYRDLLAAHERSVRVEVEQAGGSLVNVTGDGTFSVFDGPVAAIRCAERVRRGARELGLEVRAGVHTGDVQRAGPELTGMTVHVGARIGAAAAAGEVLVSRAARDLSMGSGLSFVDHGERKLKGVPGRWRLYALAGADHTPRTVSRKAPRLSLIDQALLRTARRAPQVLRAAVSMAYARQRWSSRQGWSGD